MLSEMIVTHMKRSCRAGKEPKRELPRDIHYAHYPICFDTDENGGSKIALATRLNLSPDHW